MYLIQKPHWDAMVTTGVHQRRRFGAQTGTHSHSYKLHDDTFWAGMDVSDVTLPGRFQLSGAEGQPPSAFILESQSNSQEAHQSIALGFGMSIAPTRGTAKQGVEDENFLGVPQP